MTYLKDKTVLITGGTSGIGHAAARLFLDQGARVAITGQDAGRLDEARRSLGPEVLACRADVTSASDLAAVARQVGQAFGGLDALLANAGIAEVSPLAEASEAHIDRLIDVNLKGALRTLQQMLPLLRNPSSVVLTASTLAGRGVPGLGVYAASKAALRSLARTLSAEWLARGIRVNVLSPGLTQTPIYGKLGLDPAQVAAWAGELLQGVPAGRMAQADEVARVAVFLASEASSYMLGENVVADGGLGSL